MVRVHHASDIVAQEGASTEAAPTGLAICTTDCYECSTPLHGPYCPACNPEMAHAGELLAALREAREELTNYACYAVNAPCIRDRVFIHGVCQGGQTMCGRGAGDAIILADAAIAIAKAVKS